MTIQIPPEKQSLVVELCFVASFMTTSDEVVGENAPNMPPGFVRMLGKS